MSAQRLSDKKLRHIQRVTGLPVVRAWAHGGYVYDFVTPFGLGAHQHGTIHKDAGKPGSAHNEFELYSHGSVAHYSTCRELFPADPEWRYS